MRRRSCWLESCLAAALVLTVSLPAAADPNRRVQRKDSAIKVLGDLDTALATAKAARKPIVLTFTAVWCPICRELEERTLLEPSIQVLADDFVWVTIDVDRQLSVAEEWGVEATPTVFILIDQSGRDEFPQDQTNIYIDPRDGNPPIVLHGDDASGTYTRDLLVTLQHSVSCGTERWPAFSWAVTGRYSIDRPDQIQGDRFDVAVSAAVSRRFGELYAYLTLGYAWFGSEAVSSIEFDNSPDFGVHAAWTQRF